MTRAIRRIARDHAATRVTGHRGARGLWPENSLEGFRQVTALDVDAVEFDVHRSDAGGCRCFTTRWWSGPPTGPDRSVG